MNQEASSAEIWRNGKLANTIIRLVILLFPLNSHPLYEVQTVGFSPIFGIPIQCNVLARQIKATNEVGGARFMTNEPNLIRKQNEGGKRMPFEQSVGGMGGAVVS